jgi:hypothetical protein
MALLECVLVHRRPRPFAPLVTLCLLMAAGCSWRPSSPAPSSPDDGAQGDRAPRELGPPEFKLSAVELTSAFRDSAEEAKNQYLGKVVEVEGDIAARHDYMGSPVIQLAGVAVDKSQDPSATDPTVMCMFEHPVKSLLELTIGQHVVIQGICNGGVGDLVGVNEARIVRLGEPLPVVIIPAAEFTAEYQADEDAADDKYGWKEVTLDGTIAEIQHNDEDSPQQVTGITLAGCSENEEHPLRVYCRFAPAHWGTLADLKVGQGVRVRGECQSGIRDEGIVFYTCILRPREPKAE